MDVQAAPQLAGIHEIRFHAHQHHTELDPDAVTTINDPRESAERHEQTATRPSEGTR